MSHEVDRAYYRQCAIRERERAEQAADISVRHSHEQLAELYERKAAKIAMPAAVPR
ncbi:hypothetical protein BH10PSE13_BH10PSE13_21550 [soil metagenome]